MRGLTFVSTNSVKGQARSRVGTPQRPTTGIVIPKGPWEQAEEQRHKERHTGLQERSVRKRGWSAERLSAFGALAASAPHASAVASSH